MDLSIAFLAGLTSGGVSCLAIQSGLLTAVSSRRKDLIIFLLAKLISYTILGYFLGLIGSVLIISPKVQGMMQIAVGIFMIITALKILNLHPFLKYFAFKPSKRIFKFIKKQSLPYILGGLTVLIPCGVTQGIMLLILSEKNPVWGALIMFFFTLGTIPIFLIVGLATAKILKVKFLSIIAGVGIAVIGLYSINSGLILNGQVLFPKYTETRKADIKSGFQEVVIYVTNTGYKTNIDTVKSGIPVRLFLITENTQSCTRYFAIPSLNYSKNLPTSGTEIIEFTPTEEKTIIYTCSMGMYTGSLKVIK